MLAAVKDEPSAALRTARVYGRDERTVSGRTKELTRGDRGTIREDHDLEKIVVGHEPAVSGGLGSRFINAQ